MATAQPSPDGWGYADQWKQQYTEPLPGGAALEVLLTARRLPVSAALHPARAHPQGALELAAAISVLSGGCHPKPSSSGHCSASAITCSGTPYLSPRLSDHTP